MSKIMKDASSLSQFHSAISQICEEKGLKKESVIGTIESALAAAYKKDYGKKGQIIVSHIDFESGEAKFKQLKEVVDESVRNLEDLDKIEVDGDDFLSKAKLSKEEIESRSAQFIEEGGDFLPKFNNDKDVFLKDAKKIDKKIKLGDFLEVNLPSEGDYGRVASQTAKQVIIQKLREAERISMFEEYKSKEGEIINGSVHRIEGRNVYIDLGKSIGVLYPSEQIPREYYQIGQRIRVYIKRVNETAKGSGISLSRTSAGLVEKLFELEVPEIFTKVIEIKASAREAGNRTKIAVRSKNPDIDPIGSCVGQKGTRVQAIIEELGGERIDIVEWSEKPEVLVARALSPAKVVKVELNEEEGKAKVYVENDQLSLAIGQKGQNVRLATKLTGWKINIEGIEGEESDEKVKTSSASASFEDTADKEATEDKSSSAKATEDKKEKKTKETPIQSDQGAEKEDKSEEKPEKEALDQTAQSAEKDEDTEKTKKSKKKVTSTKTSKKKVEKTKITKSKKKKVSTKESKGTKEEK
jgi:N utilization substance protein A